MFKAIKKWLERKRNPKQTVIIPKTTSYTPTTPPRSKAYGVPQYMPSSYNKKRRTYEDSPPPYYGAYIDDYVPVVADNSDYEPAVDTSPDTSYSTPEAPSQSGTSYDPSPSTYDSGSTYTSPTTYDSGSTFSSGSSYDSGSSGYSYDSGGSFDSGSSY